MTARRLATLTTSAVLLFTGLGVMTSAEAVPPPYPTGTFAITPSPRYLHGVRPGVHTAAVAIRTLTLSPDSFVDAIDPGTRTSGKGTFFYQELSNYHDGDYHWFWQVYYDEPGTFTPRVFVTDTSDQTTIVTLPPVTILTDSTPPTGDLTLPAPAVRHTIAAWRHLAGHAADPETAIFDVDTSILQRRRGVWYVYSSLSGRWLKGTRSEAWTYQHVHARTVRATLTGTSTWSQPRIKGLTTGLLVVRVVLRNKAGLRTSLPVTRYQLLSL
jgi:hypothetical protein